MTRKRLHRTKNGIYEIWLEYLHRPLTLPTKIGMVGGGWAKETRNKCWAAILYTTGHSSWVGWVRGRALRFADEYIK